MQALHQHAKCHYCDILLEGRDQFVGHMIHGHEMPLGDAEVAWKSERAMA